MNVEVIKNLIKRLEGLSEMSVNSESLMELRRQEINALKLVVNKLSDPNKYYMLFGNVSALVNQELCVPGRLIISLNREQNLIGILMNSASFDKVLIDLHSYGLDELALNALYDRKLLLVPELDLSWMRVDEFSVCRLSNGSFFLIRFIPYLDKLLVPWHIMREIRLRMLDSFSLFVGVFRSIES